jgi:hypothetical protein
MLRKRRTTRLISALIAAGGWCAGSAAGVQEFTSRAAWEAAVGGSFTTIGFTEYADGTIITDQYDSLGITFTDSNDSIVYAPPSFLNDSIGLGGGSIITLSFANVQYWVAVDYPGALDFELYRRGELVYASGPFGLSGAGHYAGIVSSVPFDTVILDDWFDEYVFIDDLHFGVPGPTALGAMLVGAGLVRTQRRRPSPIDGNEGKGGVG